MDTRNEAPLSAHLADRLRVLRAERGVSMQALADASGIPKHAIAAIEAYERRVVLDELPRLCVALDCALADLLAGPDVPALRLGDRRRDPDLVTRDDDGSTSVVQIKTYTDPLAARVAAVEARLAALEASR